MQNTYHIRVKENYAAAIIEDLQKKGAVEFIPDEKALDIPDWQKKEVKKRIEKYKNSPELLIDEQSFFEMLSE